MHGHHCLLRCVEVSLNELQLVMCLLVQRSLEPHCWLRQRRRWTKILEPIRATWPSSGVIIVFNGWTDPTRHPLINFMVSSQNGPVFLKAVDALGKYKDAHFMGELFIKIIEEVGVDSCVQIITNNAPVCKAVGMIVETKYPQVISFMTPFIVNDLSC